MAKHRNDGLRNEIRIGLLMSLEELEAIDDWRFASRIGSRIEAIRRLITLGLKSSAGPSDD